jgi:hypothetical protein
MKERVILLKVDRFVQQICHTFTTGLHFFHLTIGLFLLSLHFWSCSFSFISFIGVTTTPKERRHQKERPVTLCVFHGRPPKGMTHAGRNTHGVTHSLSSSRHQTKIWWQEEEDMGMVGSLISCLKDTRVKRPKPVGVRERLVLAPSRFASPPARVSLTPTGILSLSQSSSMGLLDSP